MWIYVRWALPRVNPTGRQDLARNSKALEIWGAAIGHVNIMDSGQSHGFSLRIGITHLLLVISGHHVSGKTLACHSSAPRGVEALVRHEETEPSASAAAKGEGSGSKEGPVFAGRYPAQGSRSQKGPVFVAWKANPAWVPEELGEQPVKIRGRT